MGYRSRFLPRVSPRILTLSPRTVTPTQLDTPTVGVLGGVSGLRMLDGPNRAAAKNVQSSDELIQDQSIERTDISTHTADNAGSFSV